MSGGEIAALIGALASLLTSAGAFLAVVGHLLQHARQDKAQAAPPAAGNATTPHP